MSKFIVCVKGYPLVNGYKQWHFFWDQALGVYVYKSKKFGPEEFNQIVEEAIMPYRKLGLQPEVRCVETDAETLDVAPPAPIVISPHNADELAVETAEEVLRQLAPHRLRKKPGPKAEEPLAAVG